MVTFLYERTSTGYSAYLPTDLAIYTTGKDLNDLSKNAVEAYNLHADEVGKPPITEKDIALKYDN